MPWAKWDFYPQKRANRTQAYPETFILISHLFLIVKSGLSTRQPLLHLISSLYIFTYLIKVGQTFQTASQAQQAGIACVKSGLCCLQQVVLGSNFISW